MKEFRGWDGESISQAFEFIVKGMSRDGTFREATLREMVDEEKTRLNLKREVLLSQVADFEPLLRVGRDISK